MSEPAFDTLEAARRLKAAGMDSEHAEAIVAVMGQSVNQLVTREYLDAAIAKLGTELHARIDGMETRLLARIDGVETQQHSRVGSVNTNLLARIDGMETRLHGRIGGVETKLQSLEATLRSEIMRAILIVVGVLIPATGLMMAIIQFYSTRLGGA